MGCNRIIEPLGIVDRRSSTGVMTAGYRTMMPGLFGCIQTSKVSASVMHRPQRPYTCMIHAHEDT
jgi:hypothetical protein